jgi:hypothetical protein
MKENGSGGDFMYGIFDTLEEPVLCHNVPPPTTTINRKTKPKNVTAI